jgi:hypothetical protein
MCDHFVGEFNNQSIDKKFINRIKSTIFLFLDTKENLKICVDEFSKETESLKASFEKPDDKLPPDEVEEDEADEAETKDEDALPPNDTDALPPNDVEKCLNDVNNKFVHKMYKNISVKCHPDKTKNEYYAKFFQDSTKLYKESKIAEFIALFFLHEKNLPNIKHNLDFNDITLRNIIIKDLENYMKEIYYMQNTNAWKWYYGDELKKMEIINDIKTQLKLEYGYCVAEFDGKAIDEISTCDDDNVDHVVDEFGNAVVEDVVDEFEEENLEIDDITLNEMRINSIIMRNM